MAIFFDAPVSPDDLTMFIREVPMRPELRLTALFGPPKFEADNTFDFANIVHTNRTAKYRTFDGRISVSSRDTGNTGRVKLAPLSSSLNMGEYERLQLEFARTAGTFVEALANAIYNDAENLTREIQNRIELAWGDVLVDGKLSINENGLVSEADYGVPGTHIVTAGTPWTTIASADLITDLITWTDVYVATNGFMPAELLTSLRVIRLMQTNAKIIAAIKGSAAGVSRVNRTEINEFLSSEGLPTLADPYDLQLDVDGSATRVIPNDRLIMLPPNPSDLGATVMGVSATALELVNSNEADMSFSEAAGIAGVVEKVGPPYRQFTYVDAVGQPVLTDARKLFVADVA